MRRLGPLLFSVMLAGVLSGCEGFTLFVSTGPIVSERHSPALLPVPIFVGDVVHSTFIVPEVLFDVRPLASGILFSSLSWDPREGDIDFRFLSAVFATNVQTAASTGQSSTVRSVRVTGGQTYRIAVVGSDGPVPFTLTTSMP